MRIYALAISRLVGLLLVIGNDVYFSPTASAGELVESTDYRRPNAPTALLERDILCAGPQTLLVSLKKSTPSVYIRGLAAESSGDVVWMRSAGQIQLIADKRLLGTLIASPQVLHIFRPSPPSAELMQRAATGPIPVILTLAVELPPASDDDDRQNRIRSVREQLLADLAPWHPGGVKPFDLVPNLGLTLDQTGLTHALSSPLVCKVSADKIFHPASPGDKE